MTSTLLKGISSENRSQVEALLTEFGWRLDHGDGATVAELFVPEGRLIAPGIGLALHGREAIATHFEAHTAGGIRVTRHLWSGLRIAAFEGQTLTINTVQTTYLRMASAPPTTRHVMVGETRDVLRLSHEGGCLFLERQLDVVFPFDAAMPT